MPYFTKRYHPPGTAPGELTTDASPAAPTSTVTLTIRLIDYDATEYTEKENITFEECLPHLEHPAMTWIHVHGHAAPDLLRNIGNAFGLHSLALEDVLNSGQRPKVESYDDQLFVVMSLPVHPNGSITTEQVSMFVGKDFIVSFHDGLTDPFELVRKRLRNHNGHIRSGGPDHLLYALLDVIIDEGFPVLEDFGEEIEDIEEVLLASPDKTTLNSIHHIKRELLLLRRMLWPHREVLNSLLRGDHTLIRDDTKTYLRDCYDHTIQIMDLLETYRDIMTSMLDVYLSSVSMRLNDVMRVLTVITTLFIPPTFVVGVYGMNFDPAASPWNMPELGWKYGYVFAWLIIIAMMCGMLIYFKRKKWF